MLKSDAKVAATIIFAATINSAPTVYNWYHSNTTDIHYVHEYRPQLIRNIPLPSCFSSFPFAPHLHPPYLLGTLLAVIGSVHLVSRLLVN